MSDDEKRSDLALRICKLEGRLRMLFVAWVSSLIAGAICVALLAGHLYHDAVAFETLFNMIKDYHKEGK